MKYLKNKKHIHFIAIGGIGMSAIALVLLKRGYKISGSDTTLNNLTVNMQGLGAKIYNGHNKANIVSDVDLVVYSSCIKEDNPEMQEALKRNISIVPRGVILAELFSDEKGIAVCGCHGKTTTSSMLATILTSAGLDPTVMIGGEVNFLGSNARNGSGPHVVVEADESDGSFLKLKPLYSVITNIDEDHMDYFKDTNGLISRFKEYIANTKKGGSLIYFADDARLSKLKGESDVDAVSFGFGKNADVHAENIISLNCQTSFDCYVGSKLLGNFKLSVPGIHNVLNALAAICVCLKLKIAVTDIAVGLKEFTGTKRRFQIKGCFNGVTVVEDYAHHPTEIMATLKTAESLKPKRIIGVFQPHRFTRTMNLIDRFSNCFSASDYLILTDIYSASEKTISGVTGKVLYDKVIESGHSNVFYLDKNKITDHLCKVKKPGDMILVLGAGDINKVADELVQRLK